MRGTLEYEYQFRCWYLCIRIDPRFHTHDDDTKRALIQSLECHFDGQEETWRRLFWKCWGAKLVDIDTSSEDECTVLNSPSDEEP